MQGSTRSKNGWIVNYLPADDLVPANSLELFGSNRLCSGFLDVLPGHRVLANFRILQSKILHGKIDGALYGVFPFHGFILDGTDDAHEPVVNSVVFGITENRTNVLSFRAIQVSELLGFLDEIWGSLWIYFFGRKK